MKAKSLPAGSFTYESIASDVQNGKYDFASLRTASGRKNFLIGITPQQFNRIKQVAKEMQVALILYGSRVSGPRSRQRTLHPVLFESLPLKSNGRLSTHKYPGTANIEIDKTVIKELGFDNPNTSDLSVVVVDLLNRDRQEMLHIANTVEEKLATLDTTFPIRIFYEPFGRSYKDENDFQTYVGSYLETKLPAGHSHTSKDACAAAQELYVYIGGKSSLLRKSDVINGLVAAATTSASFSLVLGFHPIIPATGFLVGLFGRYLSRYRAYLSQGKSKLSVVKGLAFDWGFGVFIMAGIVNPIAGFGIGVLNILSGSLLHSLSKGYVRIGIDRIFAKGTHKHQAWGVFLNTTLNLALGVLTSFVYTGSLWAYLVHACIFSAGVAINLMHHKNSRLAS